MSADISSAWPLLTKGLYIELPIDGSFEVKKVDILEKKVFLEWSESS
jgi:hypothetical protein